MGAGGAGVWALKTSAGDTGLFGRVRRGGGGGGVPGASSSEKFEM